MYLQPLWRCQKQPWTKMTVLYLGSTISGLPGRSFRCRRNLYPMRCSKDLTFISGFVSRFFICDMFQLRCSGEIRSATSSPFLNPVISARHCLRFVWQSRGGQHFLPERTGQFVVHKRSSYPERSVTGLLHARSNFGTGWDRDE